MKSARHESRNYIAVKTLFARIQKPLPVNGEVRYGIGIIRSLPGLGKTVSLEMVQAESPRRIVITPCDTVMTENSFLQAIMINLGIHDGKQAGSSFMLRKISANIMSQGTNRPIMVFDEIQELGYGCRKIWHLIKNLSNLAVVPVVCSGRPEGIDAVLALNEYNDMAWRTRQRVTLEAVSYRDLEALLADLAEAKYTPEAKKLLLKRCQGTYGELANDLVEIETQAKRAKVETIEPQHITAWRGV